MVSKDCTLSKLVTAVNRKHVTLMIPQKVEIIVTEAGKIQRESVASYSIELSTVYDVEKRKD